MLVEKGSSKWKPLRKMYESLDFEHVQTYLQSGNVIFSSKKTDLRKLASEIVSQIENDFGFDVPVIVLKAERLQHIIANNPFADHKDSTHLHVTFLMDEPKQFDQQIVGDKKSSNEEFHFSKDVIYLYCPNGYGQTKLTNNFFESKLKTTATTRNWKTTNELLKLATQ